MQAREIDDLLCAAERLDEALERWAEIAVESEVIEYL